MGKIALCPGTYDPITEGHVDVIKRCIKVFDKVIIAVSKNPRKKPLYPILKRTEFIKKVFKKYDNIRVISFDGLLINLAEKENINVIVKGLRAISDFEYEFQMAQINKKLNPDIETMFLVTNPKYAYLSSSAVKEVAGFGGCITGLVPKEIENDIIQTFYKKK
ncbi:MAG: pantetheine-phosphate adenylyltransferase [Actinobacteria bacterium]|nr:pantetheine-phosphate adenylyltransferase [Actinomycetota bacterium]MBM3712933.1 pantetheine-phosphate adenylyltransferase [Actinomycetota bacterium]